MTPGCIYSTAKTPHFHCQLQSCIASSRFSHIILACPAGNAGSTAGRCKCPLPLAVEAIWGQRRQCTGPGQTAKCNTVYCNTRCTYCASLPTMLLPLYSALPCFTSSPFEKWACSAATLFWCQPFLCPASLGRQQSAATRGCLSYLLVGMEEEEEGIV